MGVNKDKMAASQPFKYTKYERARIIGARALQISMGAPFLIKLSEQDIEQMKYNPVSIAKLEFSKGIIPFSIVRPMPQAIVETASIEEISTLGKKLIKELQESFDDGAEEETPAAEEHAEEATTFSDVE